MKYDKTNIPHIHWIAILFIVSAVGWSIYESQVKDNHIEQMGDIMDLRGTNIVAIRVLDPAQSALQRLDIYEEGGAAASVIPSRVGVRVRRLALASTDMSDLETFRQRWCANPQTFRIANQGETYYDVAVRCEGYNTKQVQVPEGELPTILASIVRRMPA